MEFTPICCARLRRELSRTVTAAYPNHVWGIDITYIRLSAGWLYLVAVLDWFSRYVVRWQLADTLDMDFVLLAVDGALSHHKPLIGHSDQAGTLWVHFTSPQYTERLLAAAVQISMDGKGRALDNIFNQRLWRTIKYQQVYLHDDQTPKQARAQLTASFDFDNVHRPHQALGYLTPTEVYFANTLAIPNPQPQLL